MNIQLRTIPQVEQRNVHDVGDWFERDGATHINASKLENPSYEFLILIHELIEWWICTAWGISDEIVMAWDVAWAEAHPHPAPGVEAGNDPGAPYHWPHVAAGLVERFVAFVLRVDYQAYDEAINRAIEEHAKGEKI